MTIEEYRSHPALNFSTLADLDKGPQNLLKKDREITDAMKLGSVVDCLITDPAEFEKKYTIMNIAYPSDNIKLIIDKFIELYPFVESLEVEGTFDILYNLSYVVDYGKSWKRETVVSKIREAGTEYFNFVKKSKDKVILSKEEEDSCRNLANNLLSHQFTAKYFITDKHVEILFQYAIVFTFNHNQTEYKCLLDMIRIDHKAKTIQPIDIKTTSDSIMSFPNSVWKYRYDIQSSLYIMAIYNWKATQEKLRDYQVLPFKFIVGSFSNGKVCVFNADKLFGIGANGGENKYGNKIKGWVELTELYKWHVEKQKFDYTKEVYDHQGELILEP